MERDSYVCRDCGKYSLSFDKHIDHIRATHRIKHLYGNPYTPKPTLPEKNLKPLYETLDEA